ncbi:MAG: dihydrolipoamide acetyltransferase family protein [Kiritimatiellae bacterium]|nr:dihydrolipoamide acetyltransferase family protein [Kiritimatiellia bacterium]
MAIEFRVPELGENVEAATVAKLLIAAGDTVAPGQAVAELETDKAVVEVPSDVAGTVEAVLVSVGDQVKAGQALLTLKAAAGPSPKPPPPPLPAAPAARRVARESGVDLETVPGSGPGGRIGTDDVKAAARPARAARQPAGAVPEAGAATALPDLSRWGKVERVPMTTIRRLTAERMVRSWSDIPHVTQFAQADVTEIEKLRHRYQPDAARAGGHLTLTAVLIKTVAAALKSHPNFNVSVDMERRELVQRRYYSVGIAMDTERGLVVPVIRAADTMNLIELSVELSRLTAKSWEGTLTADELQGGCITISNAGALGGDTFTPIINWPEAAILGIGRAQIAPRYENGAFQPRQMLPLSLAFDHRANDGAAGVRFLRWIVEALETPVKLLWEG